MNSTPKMFYCKKYKVSMLAKNADVVCAKRYHKATTQKLTVTGQDVGVVMKAIQFAHCLECRRGKRLNAKDYSCA